MSALKAQQPAILIPLVNDRGTVLLLSFAMSLLALVFTPRRKPVLRFVLPLSIACNTAVILGILLTMSRGAALGLATLFMLLTIMPLVLHIKARAIWISCYVSLIVAASVAAILFPAHRANAGDLFFIRQSKSQERSTAGHIASWKISINTARNRLALGIGQNNFSTNYIYQSSKQPNSNFSGQPLSTPLQVLAEQGALGLISFVYLTWICLHSAFELARAPCITIVRQEGLIIFATLVALLMRELTYSSILLNPYVSILTWLLMGLIAARTIETNPKDHMSRPWQKNRPAAIMFIIIFVCSIVIAYREAHYSRAKDLTERAMNLWHQGRSEEGSSAMTAALGHDPNNAYFLSLMGLQEGKFELSVVTVNAQCGIDLAIHAKDKTILGDAILRYRRALELVPYDDNFNSNLGWLYIYTGSRSLGHDYLKKAMALDGNEAAYHVSFGALLISEHRYNLANHEFVTAMRLRPETIASQEFRCLTEHRPADASSIVRESIKILQDDVDQKHDPITEARLGALLLYSGEVVPSIPILRNAVRDLPGLPLAWLHLGIALREVGRDQESSAAFQKAAFLEGLDPNGIEVSKMPEEFGMQTTITEHAARVLRLYMTHMLEPDDLLPPGILSIGLANHAQ
ncbi:MAG TPA: O-antigen ligase family protein [Acidobacteriaceae bacterium]|nr:O-antigen ligase family protein [Acidobacteriaceae bacterium]